MDHPTYLEQVELLELGHGLAVLHVAEHEPDHAAQPRHQVEGGQDDAYGVHGRLQLAAAPPQHQPHHLDAGQ